MYVFDMYWELREREMFEKKKQEIGNPTVEVNNYLTGRLSRYSFYRFVLVCVNLFVTTRH